ncbi:hypothetical protein [Rhizobium halophytocola]|uniref:Fimbrial protein n=1 Tax=Rhizobium halophytocola TaxID=735519 RepID=A0ABS4DSQ7_9HYPH|nr:hypothetical protein [Rhizobium halophytocola]MBP1848726.1 hypothetical protein [Rhizobium halophytocola]
MSNVDIDDQEEKPLDPAMESVRRKMIKLQLVSGGVMLVMFMAVLAAIVYKVTRPEPGAAAVASGQGLVVPSDQPIQATANLPAGFTVTSTALSGGQILFYGTAGDGAAHALVFDVKAGRMVADVTVREQ